MPHSRIVGFEELRSEILTEMLHPNTIEGVKSVTLPRLNEIVKGHRRGELTILTGPTGSGKTTLLSQLSLDYCCQGVNTLWGSFEIKNTRLAKKMLFQHAAGVHGLEVNSCFPHAMHATVCSSSSEILRGSPCRPGVPTPAMDRPPGDPREFRIGRRPV